MTPPSHLLLAAVALAAALAIGYVEREGRDATAGIVTERDAQVAQIAAAQVSGPLRKSTGSSQPTDGSVSANGAPASAAYDCQKLQRGQWLRFQLRQDYAPDANGRRFYTVRCEYGEVWRAVTNE